MFRRIRRVVRFAVKAVVLAVQVHRVLQSSPAGKAFEAKALRTLRKIVGTAAAMAARAITTLVRVADRNHRDPAPTSTAAAPSGGPEHVEAASAPVSAERRTRTRRNSDVDPEPAEDVKPPRRPARRVPKA